MILYNAIGGAGDLKAYIESRIYTTQHPLNILISFPYLENSYTILRTLRTAGAIGSLFLDAGTFTLNEGKRGKGLKKTTTRFSEYVHFVAMYHEAFDLIAAYDADFDHVAINQDLLTALEKRLSQPGTNRPAMSDAQIKSKIVPVLHSDSRGIVDEFTQYAEDGYKCVALGSKPKISVETWNSIKEIARNHGGIKLHHFGSLAPNELNNRKPDSADSTGFLKAGAFGVITWWKPGSTSIDGFEKFDLLPNTAQLQGISPVKQKHPSREFESYVINKFHWTIDELIDDSAKCAAVNLHAIMELEQWLNSQPVQNG